MSKWRAVTSDSPQGSVLGLMPFNMFVKNLDSGISPPPDKFADCIRLWGAVNILEGGNAIQRDLEQIEKWACDNSMKFHKAKCTVLLCESKPKIETGWRMSWDPHWGEIYRGVGCWEAQNNLSTCTWQPGNTTVFQAASKEVWLAGQEMCVLTLYSIHEIPPRPLCSSLWPSA